ncbi:MAG: hypothetical protein PSN34_12100 [Urechidicola sp.]|nr:hypothetical protein [Urechidicola sp.]
MIYIKRIALFSLLLFFYSCSEDGIFIPENYNNGSETPIDPEEGETEIYFTFKSYESTFYTEDWIIIHTDDGVLLDYKRYEKGDELVFETESSLLTDQISISLFKVEKYGNNQTINVYTTADVEKGAVWDNEPVEIIPDPIVGNFDLTLENFPEIIELNISNENNLITSGWYSPSSVNLNIYEYQIDEIPLYAANEYVLTFSEDQQDFKYYFLEDVQDQDDLYVGYDQFHFFDSYLDVLLPEGSYYRFSVSGFEDYQDVNESEGFTVGKALYSSDGYNYEFLDRDPLRIGYLDRFENYATELVVFTNEYNYFFNKRGTKPDEIIVPTDINFSVIDNSLDNYQFTFNKEYSKYIAMWFDFYGEVDVDFVRFQWYIEASSGSGYLLGDIPFEITFLYPNMDLDQLLYEETNFILNEEEQILMN